MTNCLTGSCNLGLPEAEPETRNCAHVDYLGRDPGGNVGTAGTQGSLWRWPRKSSLLNSYHCGQLESGLVREHASGLSHMGREGSWGFIRHLPSITGGALLGLGVNASALPTSPCLRQRKTSRGRSQEPAAGGWAVGH